MIHEIEKSTFVEADPETTKALTYDLIKGLYEKMDNLNKCYHDHIGICDGRFKELETHKMKNATKASAFGFIGGFFAVIVYWFKLLIEKII